MCQQLLLSSKLPALEKLLSQLCIRTTKESVASELSVPKQRFHLVQVTQDPIERVRYSGKPDGSRSLCADWQSRTIQRNTCRFD